MRKHPSNDGKAKTFIEREQNQVLCIEIVVMGRKAEHIYFHIASILAAVATVAVTIAIDRASRNTARTYAYTQRMHIVDVA